MKTLNAKTETVRRRYRQIMKTKKICKNLLVFRHKWKFLRFNFFRHPSEIVTQRGFKRQTSGILTPALDIVSESENKVLTEEIAPTKLFSAASSSNVTNNYIY